MVKRERHVRAVMMLALACVFWGVSFPLSKGVTAIYLRLRPDESVWFLVGIQGALRFLLAGLVMVLLYVRTLPNLTSSELTQGLSLGLFGGLGMLLQVDGLAYTSASTSAFLTQLYCVILPICHAIRFRRRPRLSQSLATLIVLAGVTILANPDFGRLRLGRGEIETLLGSCFFAAQILRLEQPACPGNRTPLVSTVMFLTIGAIFAFVAVVTNHRPAAYATLLQDLPSLLLILGLVVFSTLGAFNLMNHWQPFIPSVEAGLIYTAEPVFAALFALFLPAWISVGGQVAYPNETLSLQLLLGGSLILIANCLVQLGPGTIAPVSTAPPLLHALPEDYNASE